jgi:Flp pilus assembly protein TadD
MIAFNEGRRNTALMLVSEALRVCPAEWARIMAEGAAADAKNDGVEESES